MSGPITFNFAAWSAQYFEFASLDPSIAQAYFDMATAYCRNDGRHPASTDAILTQLLYALTAHIAKLMAPVNGSAPQVTGRISSVGEGSVNVSTELPMSSNPSIAWYQQTTYGLNYWTMSSQYRHAKYLPGPRRVFGPFFPG